MAGKTIGVFGIVASLAAAMTCGTVAAGQADTPATTKADVELTQRIRRSILEDKDVSDYGKNVKISSVNGKVTLNGIVGTEVEKQQIGQKAAAVAGPDNVANSLKITPAK
jgi:hyperosmotically inducible periplasmic protein